MTDREWDFFFFFNSGKIVLVMLKDYWYQSSDRLEVWIMWLWGVRRIMCIERIHRVSNNYCISKIWVHGSTPYSVFSQKADHEEGIWAVKKLIMLSNKNQNLWISAQSIIWKCNIMLCDAFYFAWNEKKTKTFQSLWENNWLNNLQQDLTFVHRYLLSSLTEVELFYQKMGKNINMYTLWLHQRLL